MGFSGILSHISQFLNSSDSLKNSDRLHMWSHSARSAWPEKTCKHFQMLKKAQRRAETARLWAFDLIFYRI